LAQVVDFVKSFFKDMTNGLVPSAKLVVALRHLHDKGYIFCCIIPHVS